MRASRERPSTVKYSTEPGGVKRMVELAIIAQPDAISVGLILLVVLANLHRRVLLCYRQALVCVIDYVMVGCLLLSRYTPHTATAFS